MLTYPLCSKIQHTFAEWCRHIFLPLHNIEQIKGDPSPTVTPLQPLPCTTCQLGTNNSTYYIFTSLPNPDIIYCSPIGTHTVQIYSSDLSIPIWWHDMLDYPSHTTILVSRHFFSLHYYTLYWFLCLPTGKHRLPTPNPCWRGHHRRPKRTSRVVSQKNHARDNVTRLLLSCLCILYTYSIFQLCTACPTT